MNDLTVRPWRRRGHNHLRVTRSTDHAIVATYDVTSGHLHLTNHGERDAVINALRPWIGTEVGEPGAPATLSAEHDLDSIQVHQERSLREPPAAPVGPIHRLLAQLVPLSRSASSKRGEDAEERVTGMALGRLPASWRVLHSVPLPGNGGLDHLVIGPPGVFTIESERHPGAAVWVGDYKVLVNGQPVDHLRRCLHQARRTARLLSRVCRFAVPVKPAVAVVGAERIKLASDSPAALVLDGSRIDELLGDLPPVLTDQQVEAIYAVARDRRTWQTAA